MTRSLDARSLAYKHVPNALSAVRIACAPVLLVLVVAGEQSIYTWVLVAALLTDALDGWIARAFGFQTSLGARLDSLGDSLVWFAGLAGVLAFQRDVLAEHRWLIGILVFCWITENVCALLRYGRLSSFHTQLSKIAGVLMGCYVGVLFLFGQQDWLLYAAACTSVVASLEELWLLALLPEWRADVPGVRWLQQAKSYQASTRFRSPG